MVCREHARKHCSKRTSSGKTAAIELLERIFIQMVNDDEEGRKTTKMMMVMVGLISVTVVVIMTIKITIKRNGDSDCNDWNVYDI